MLYKCVIFIINFQHGNKWPDLSGAAVIPKDRLRNLDVHVTGYDPGSDTQSRSMYVAT